MEKILKPFMLIRRCFEGQPYVPHMIKTIRYKSTRTISKNEGAIRSKVEDGAVCQEHKTRGRRQIRKGIPRIVLLAASVDPRVKRMTFSVAN